MKKNKRAMLPCITHTGLALLFLWPAFYEKTQAADSLSIEKKTVDKYVFNAKGSSFIFPAVLMAYGVSARFNESPTRRFDFSVDREMRRHFDRKYHLDDYLQVTTPILAYGLGFIPGIEALHNVRDRTLIVATSLLIMEAIVQPMKRIASVTRPEGSNPHSFPSGHTATAMMGAHLMYKEYKDVSPWIGVAGYLTATTVGVMRMVNRAHWFSDVMMGAGTGILSVEMSYLMLPVWHSLLGMTDGKQQIVAFPAIHPQNVGLGLVYRF